ncbi:helix-turn-helix domain-containing protein [Actinocorallia lasiicapitis]
MPHRIAVLILDDFASLDVGIPCQVFTSGALDGRYDLRTCSVGGLPVRCDAGYAITPEGDLSLLETADTIVIPGIHGGPPLTAGELPAELAAALHTAHRRGARLMSICTGAFVLAAAGLLAGRAATTHWWHAERFRELFPSIALDPDVLFVDSGDILTSAGVSAGIDLCLHVVRTDHGTEIANRVARRIVAAPFREGGQAQFIERPIPEPATATTSATRAWALTRLHEPLTLAALAAHATMSTRTFTRRFRAETGLSPARWLAVHRVEQARRLLESTDLPVDEVARAAGFGTAVSLRQQLHATLGVAPLAYRHSFRTS